MISLSYILIELRGEILNCNSIFNNVDFNKLNDWDFLVNYVESFQIDGVRKFEGITSFAILNTFNEEN